MHLHLLVLDCKGGRGTRRVDGRCSIGLDTPLRGCINGQPIFQEDLFARVEETNAALDVPAGKRLGLSAQLIAVHSLSAVSSAQVDDHVSGRAARDIENG